MQKPGLLLMTVLMLLAVASPNAVIAQAPPQEEMLTNATVLEMVGMGFGEAVVVQKIKTTPSTFDLSLSALKALKEAGVPEPVIAAMLEAATSAMAVDESYNDPNDPLAPHDPGIYLFREGALEELRPSIYTQAKSGGFLKSAFTYGVAKIKSKAVLPGTAARLEIEDSIPTFYFYFEETETGLSRQEAVSTNPGEFILAEFKVNSKKGCRELVVGQMNAFGAQSGALDKSVRGFDYEELGSGVFKVTPKQSLEVGEYGFYYAGAVPLATYGYLGGQTGGKIFDFSIRR